MNAGDSLQQVMRLIHQAQKDAEFEVNPENPYIRAMRDYFEAEGCVALVFEGKDEIRVAKKEFSRGPDWRITSGMIFEAGLLFSAFQSHAIREFTSPSKIKGYNQLLDSVKLIEPQLLVCGPVQNHEHNYGVIGLVNPHNYSSGTGDMMLFQLFLTALASQYQYSILSKEIRAVDQDLQVSRLQLLNSRNALRSLFDNIPDSFYMVDSGYHLEAVNLSRANRTGKPPRELVGKQCYQALFGLDHPCSSCLVKDVVETGMPGHLYGHNWTTEKNPREWDIKCYPVMSGSGKAVQVILLEQDVTEKRKMESDLIQNEKLLAMGQLAAGVAHEINNPLTSILANSQMLMLDIDPEQNELVEAVTLIEMAARRATKVVENLQTMVRREKFEFLPMDLNESIQNALMLVSHEFMSRQISIRFNPGAGMPQIVASGDHLQGVWINLLMNAIEAIEEFPGEIKIGTLFDSETFYVEIKDSGIGIPEEDLEKVFEPFFSTKKSRKGTGLGLSLAKRIIQAHDGSIQVESAPQQGTRFTIVLPSRTAEELSRSSKGDLGLI